MTDTTAVSEPVRTAFVSANRAVTVAPVAGVGPISSSLAE
jgi:hypothetical protein